MLHLQNLIAANEPVPQGFNFIRRQQTTLTAAQIKAAVGSPIAHIPAPSSDQRILCLWSHIKLTAGGVVFANNAANFLDMVYAGGTHSIFGDTPPTFGYLGTAAAGNGWINLNLASATDVESYSVTNSVADGFSEVAAAPSTYLGKGVSIINPNVAAVGNLTNGTGSLTWTTYYLVL